METLKRAILPAAAGWLAIDIYMSGVYVALGSTPLRLFQWDASNVLGDSAYSGGLRAGILGLALDYVVSFVWAVIAAYLLGRIALVRKHPAIFGVLYGIVVMYVMIWLVVPLGHAHQAPMTWKNFAIVVVGHTLFFGLPLALSFRAGAMRWAWAKEPM